jgi:hypothetical protein
LLHLLTQGLLLLVLLLLVLQSYLLNVQLFLLQAVPVLLQVNLQDHEQQLLQLQNPLVRLNQLRLMLLLHMLLL